MGQRAGTRPSVFSQPVDDHFSPPGRPSALSSEVFPAQHTKSLVELIGIFSGVNGTVSQFQIRMQLYRVVRMSTQPPMHRRDRVGGIVR